MPLGRLRVREKLALLVLLPLVAMVLATVPFVAGRVQTMLKARESADVLRHAVQLGTLIQEVQQERLLALGFLGTGSSRDRLVVRAATVDDTAALVRVQLSRHMTPLLDDALDQVGKLGALRGKVLRRTIPPDLAFVYYSDVIGGLINSLGLTTDANLQSPTGQQEFALDALIRHDEASAAVGAALLVPRPGRRVNARTIGLVSAATATERTEEQIFFRHASAVTKELYLLVQEGPARQYVARHQDLLVDAPADALKLRGLPPDLQPAVESLTELNRLVQIKIAGDAARSATRTKQAAAVAGIVVILLALLLLGLVVLLSVQVARAIATPLRQLTASAEEVAEVAQAELTRVSDEERLEVAAPQLVPVTVATADELGELATAFNRVQQVAAELVERQLISRRNVATMFGNVGRRTQNLVGRQLAMIDALERNLQDPALLERLYRLDHVSTRLRRNANSLVVLSGAAEPSVASEPLSISDAIRSALGEIEGFQRVRLREVDHVRLGPDVAADVILLLAALLENSTSFSPPYTEVDVYAQVVGDACRVRIVDRGIGMTSEQLAVENARLVERERLDLAPTDVLGLFVVGRLARRHGIRVSLRPTPGTGVTAEVLIPERHLMDDAGRPSLPRSQPEAQDRPARPSGADNALAAGGGPQVPERGWWDPAALPGAPPQRRLSPPAASPQSWSGHPVGPAAGVPPVMPSASAGAADAAGLDGLNQRVPGSQLPQTGLARSSRDPSEPQTDEARWLADEDGVRRAQYDTHPESRRDDGAAAYNRPHDRTRALMDEFESGVRRALANLAAVTARHQALRRLAEDGRDPAVRRTDNGRRPVGPASPQAAARPLPSAGPPSAGSAPIQPGVTHPDGIHPDLIRPEPRPGAGRSAAVGPSGRPMERTPFRAPAESAAVPAPRAGSDGALQNRTEGLTRRVPGAQLPIGVAAAMPTVAPSPSANDPAAARALIEEFEAGVARAVNSMQNGGTAEGTEGDGE